MIIYLISKSATRFYSLVHNTLILTILSLYSHYIFLYCFLSSNGQYLVAGSDDGSFFMWEKSTTNIVRVLRGDDSIVNCLQPHPTHCLLATSGIDPVVRLWSPRPEVSDNLYTFCTRYFFLFSLHPFFFTSFFLYILFSLHPFFLYILLF